MSLFGNENDLIKRILNLILVIWLIITIAVSYSNTVDLLFDYSLEKYDDYKILYCDEDEETCKDRYDYDKINYKLSKTTQVKSLINSSGNFLVVTVFIFILNRKK